MYARRDLLKKAAYLTGASVFPHSAIPMVASAVVQNSPADTLSRLHPFMPINGDSHDYFVGVDSYRESVGAVIRYSTGENPDRPLIISDFHKLNGMGSTSLMLVSRTLRLHTGTILYSGANFYTVIQQSNEVTDKFRRYLLLRLSLNQPT
jgi:hypothetical protein